MNKTAIVFLTAFVIISCKKAEADGIPDGNNFYFVNPQPINDSELSSIPNKFQGIYRNSDSSYLNITKNSIFKRKQFQI